MISLIALSFILHVTLINACARTSPGGGGGGGGGGVVTPPEQCPPKAGQVALYEDKSLAIPNDFYGKVPATSTCITCSSGSTKYYPDSGVAVPMAVNEKAIGGIICTNFCLCTADGTCFQRNSADTSVVLYPYCSGGSCSVYALVLAQTANEGIVSTTGTTTITAASQVDPTTRMNFPVTQDSLYPKITAASCNGCNFAKSCP